MKKVFFFLSAIAIISIIACNNSGHDHPQTTESKSEADSLMDKVMEGHNIAMPKMGKLSKASQEAQRLMDSISKLPAKAKEATAPLTKKLDELKKELDYADMAMNKWMEEFKFDSTFSNTEEKIKYLTEEKIKVDKVKDAVLNSLQKADSVLQKKF